MHISEAEVVPKTEAEKKPIVPVEHEPQPPVSWKGIFFNGRKVANVMIWTKFDTVVNIANDMKAAKAEHADVRMNGLDRDKNAIVDANILLADEKVEKEIDYRAIAKDAILMFKVFDL